MVDQIQRTVEREGERNGTEKEGGKWQRITGGIITVDRERKVNGIEGWWTEGMKRGLERKREARLFWKDNKNSRGKEREIYES